MLSLLGSLMGFGTSFLPKVMDYFQDKSDKAHELELMSAQIDQQKALGEIKLQHLHVEADIKESDALRKHSSRLQSKASPWVVNMAASVRPVLTYLLAIEFGVLTLCVSMDWMTADQYNMIWNAEFQAVWAAVVSFWFGSRTYARKTQT
mgnify:FL=1|tara:strand:+ start:638 stop:1084 length:447 start_codon:yes stop_codon:yes gene_type:complete